MLIWSVWLWHKCSGIKRYSEFTVYFQKAVQSVLLYPHSKIQIFKLPENLQIPPVISCILLYLHAPFQIKSLGKKFFLLSLHQHSSFHFRIILRQIFLHLPSHPLPVPCFHLAVQRMIHRDYTQILRIIQEPFSLKFLKRIGQHTSLHCFLILQHRFIIRACTPVYGKSPGYSVLVKSNIVLQNLLYFCISNRIHMTDKSQQKWHFIRKWIISFFQKFKEN